MCKRHLRGELARILASNLLSQGSAPFTPEDSAKSREYLERAVALELRHAPAWFALADFHIGGAYFSFASPRRNRSQPPRFEGGCWERSAWRLTC